VTLAQKKQRSPFDESHSRKSPPSPRRRAQAMPTHPRRSSKSRSPKKRRKKRRRGAVGARRRGARPRRWFQDTQSQQPTHEQQKKNFRRRQGPGALNKALRHGRGPNARTAARKHQRHGDQTAMTADFQACFSARSNLLESAGRSADPVVVDFQYFSIRMFSRTSRHNCLQTPAIRISAPRSMRRGGRSTPVAPYKLPADRYSLWHKSTVCISIRKTYGRLAFEKWHPRLLLACAAVLGSSPVGRPVRRGLRVDVIRATSSPLPIAIRISSRTQPGDATVGQQIAGVVRAGLIAPAFSAPSIHTPSSSRSRTSNVPARLRIGG